LDQYLLRVLLVAMEALEVFDSCSFVPWIS
jgi:hypothetical protein